MGKIARHIVTSLFPTPRQRVRPIGALPLVLFLVLFGGLCLFFDLSHRLLFARPAAFGLLLATPWLWWMHVAGYAGLGRVRSLVALEIRLLLAGLFVILLADPRAVRTSDELSVIYALDVSDSVDGNDPEQRMLQQALRFVANTATQKRSTDRAGLVVFGKNAAVEFPARPNLPLDKNSVDIILNSLIDKEATNLEQGLSLAAAMLPEETQGRIVLISDGMQTEGNLGRILDDLKAKGASVDVIPIQYSFENEVWLERLELPQFVKVGENYEAGIVLSSLVAGEGTLQLEENGELISSKTVDFQAGKNRFTMPVYLRNAGYYEYTATILPPEGKDNLKQNNKVINSLFLEGEGKVLVVTDPQGEERDSQPMVRALREAKHFVEIQTAYDFPRDSSSLLPYDCIVFLNAPADAFDTVQLQALRDSVYNFGSGFLMVGGANSFGPGGYHRTVVEEALPVTMDISQKKVLPKGALVIILHTCEFPEGNTWAKRITKQAIKVLGAQDEVGCLIYGPTGEEWVFKLTPAGDYEKLVPKINKAEPGDMPTFDRTMKMGLSELKKSDAATKHMIIISDGDPQPAAPSVLQDYIDNKISISTVAVFPHGGSEIGLLRTVAEATGGRYYFPDDPKRLPAIFIKESKTLKRSMIQNKTISPEIGFDDQSVLKGIDSMPPLKGYVITTAKPHPAMTVLQVPSQQSDESAEEEDGDIDPILAIWRYGLGQSAAFTSDLSPNWAADWMGWDKYDAFVQQLITRIARVRKEGHLRMWTYTSGNEGVIVVEDFHEQEQFLEIQARMTGPHDRAETIPLRQTGPRRYQASIPLWGKGRYHIVAAPVAGERTEDRAFGGFIVPYSPEYLRFRSNPLVLKEIAERTGGQELEPDATAEQIFNTNRQPKRSSRPIFDWFLIALAILVPLDVAVRRVQLDWSVIRGWFGLGRRSGPSSQTMGALLERKQAVDSQIEARRAETPMVSRLPTIKRADPGRVAKPTPPGVAAGAPTQGKAPQADPTTTTERLLKLKRKRQQDDP
ncbi:MAG: VWA domain-containing protein [Planctomycetaceae bacterium]|nr:VWA domain-containing protein [Planctomycetaceae bacterium]